MSQSVVLLLVILYICTSLNMFLNACNKCFEKRIWDFPHVLGPKFRWFYFILKSRSVKRLISEIALLITETEFGKKNFQ